MKDYISYKEYEMATKLRSDCFGRILMSIAFIAVAIFVFIDPCNIYNTAMMIYGVVLVVLAVITITYSVIVYRKSDEIAKKYVKKTRNSGITKR